MRYLDSTKEECGGDLAAVPCVRHGRSLLRVCCERGSVESVARILEAAQQRFVLDGQRIDTLPGTIESIPNPTRSRRGDMDDGQLIVDSQREG